MAKILETGNEPITLIYYAINEIAKKYDMTFEQVMSVLTNYREDLHQKALKQPFVEPINIDLEVNKI
ncbi:MAG: hypothetical protein GY861_17095 [bacterium]|nr:hypothetical protein [bacterium]